MEKRSKKSVTQTKPLTAGDETNTVSSPVVSVDVDAYAHFLDGADLTETQKEELLQALWSIIVEFVSLGFGVHPIQQAMGDDPVCKKQDNKLTQATPPVLRLDHPIIEHEIIQSVDGKSEHSNPADYDREV
ncbi:MAG: hypothetical protein AAFW83_12745 [Pseudomonadota bacterium]